MTRSGLLLAMAALVLPGGAMAAAGDAAKGRAVFARCMACHQTAAGRNMIGPTMARVLGRRAGTLPGYAYSAAMRRSGLVWTPATLDAYLVRPMARVPGTKMIFAGVPNPTDRANLIAYLATLR